MKTAKASPAAYYLTCPHCGEMVGNPVDGSFLWSATHPYPATVDCLCGETIRVAKAVVGRTARTT